MHYLKLGQPFSHEVVLKRKGSTISNLDVVQCQLGRPDIVSVVSTGFKDIY